MRILISFCTFFCFIQFANGQNFWSTLESAEINHRSQERTAVNPTQYKTFDLDLSSMTDYLQRTQSVEQFKNGNSFILDIPMPSGEIKSFNIWEAPILQGTTAERFSTYKTYKGVSIDKERNVMRFDITNKGFRAAIESIEGTIYVDPMYQENKDIYLTYYITDEQVPDELKLPCGFEPSSEEMEPTPSIQSREEVLPLRSYVIAVACTGEYGQIVGGVDNAMSEIVTSMNRLNMIFENESSITFTLIEGNEEVIFDNPDTDPYIINPNTDGGVHPGGQVLQQNTNILNNAFGAAAYDIGHCFTRSCTDGLAGVAGGQVCTSNAGAGVSCVGGANVTAFTISVIAHEVGHQFGAGHTWSNCDPDGNGGGNQQLAAGSACEPGGGSTIMSYAGTCNTDQQFAGNNDDYFHVCSLDQIHNLSRVFGIQCADEIDNGNHPPMVFVDLRDDIVIPRITPFELTGSATDMDGDVLTYSWDQIDRGPTSNLGSPLGNAPSFRSYPPSTNPTRSFPRTGILLTGSNSDTEVLPSSSRDFTFAFVVRDNNPTGGATEWVEYEFRSTSNAGPFFVTKPNVNPDDFEVGQSTTIEWDVANTDSAPVNCSAVDILLSTDGGNNFDHVLVLNTPNDGSEEVRIPNAISDDCRIKIRARDNIFFDINNEDFEVIEPSEPTFVYDFSQSDFELCLPASVEIDINSTAFQGYSEPIELSVIEGIPEGAEVTIEPSVIPPDGSATLRINMDNVVTGGDFRMVVQGTSGDLVFTNFIGLKVTGTDFSDLEATAPASGTMGSGLNPTFQWTEAANALSYTFELSDNPSFQSENTIVVSNLTDAEFTPEVILDNSTLYYWRVTPLNICTVGTATAINTIGTAALSCQNLEADDLPKNISQSGTPTVTSAISIFQAGQISSVSVTNIKGLHDRISDLKATLTSPAGTEVVLFDRICGNSSNFNCGFNDDSPVDLGCPLSNGATYKPDEQLSAFAGEDIMGDWVLTIDDTSAGGSGAFQEYSLELCSNATLEGPELQRNELLELPPLGRDRIDNFVLKAIDDNNSEAELIFTLVTLPTSGFITLNANPLVVGDQFTQQQISAGAVKYTNSVQADEDSFEFTVIDGEGGWIDLTTFNISIVDGAITSTADLEEDLFEMMLSPNPTNGRTVLEINTTSLDSYQINLFDINGKVIRRLETSKGSDTIEINLQDHQSGVYFVQLQAANRLQTKKLILVK